MDPFVAIMYRSLYKQIGLIGLEDDISYIAALKVLPMFTWLNMDDVHFYTPMNQPWWRNLLFSLKHRHLDHCEGPQKSRSNCNSVWVGIVTVHGWSMTPVSPQGFEEANSKWSWCIGATDVMNTNYRGSLIGWSITASTCDIKLSNIAVSKNVVYFGEKYITSVFFFRDALLRFMPFFLEICWSKASIATERRPFCQSMDDCSWKSWCLLFCRV